MLQLEQKIIEDYEDLAAFAVYADWLIERGDPRGELIQVQLALEDEALSPRQRQPLQAREKALLDAHARTWLGPLAELLLDVDIRQPWHNPRWRFQRGFLAFLELNRPEMPVIRALLTSPEVRFLRSLSLDYLDRRGEEREALAQARLPQLRVLQLGDGEGHLWEDGLATRLVPSMPQLEELGVHGRGVDTEALFGLSLPLLRSLAVTCTHHFATEVLAANTSLAHLESLTLRPHQREPDESDGYLALEDLSRIVRSPVLSRLEHLSLHCCTAGDEGCRLLAESGALGRLSSLDLSFGEITDVGARLLVGSLDPSRLRRLWLSYNSLTEEGVALLEAAGLAEVRVNDQRQWGEEREYLENGCCE
jgi:uncharacterized protein (TIGR02996 family)